jgi:hypothetical protein
LLGGRWSEVGLFGAHVPILPCFGFVKVQND